MEGIKIGDKLFNIEQIKKINNLFTSNFGNEDTKQKIIELFKNKYHKGKNINGGVIDAFDCAIAETQDALKKHKKGILKVNFSNKDIKNAFWEMYFKRYK